MRISVVVNGLSEATERLQPWRYVSELATGLARRGHSVEIITDNESIVLDDLGKPVRLGHQSFQTTSGTEDHLRATRPDLVMWNAGATSALRLKPSRLVDTCHVAVFTSPLYRPSDLWGVRGDLIRHPADYAVLALGSLVPRRGIARYLGAEFTHVIAPGSTAVGLLVASGLRSDQITALPPGRDTDINLGPAALPSTEGRTTFLYAGSPLPIRGPDLLIRAFAESRVARQRARLLILSRHERAGLARHTGRLVELAMRLGVSRQTEIVSGTLPRREFLQHVAHAGVFVLPFRLVPSEAPLAVLEAAGAGRPLIASALPAVADLAAPGSLLVRPGDVGDLSRALTSLVTDPARVHQLGIDASRSYAAWPTWPDVAERLDGILTGLVQASNTDGDRGHSPGVSRRSAKPE